jgi:L-amino acid N-acyltransferase YncA
MLDSVGVDAFRPEYDFLSTASPEWGKIALLPWDEEVFGFPVADFELGPNPPQIRDLPLFINALEDFSARTKAQLISTHVQGDDMSTIALIERMGFSLVDFSLTASTSRFKTALTSSSGTALREATAEDHPSICQIAGTGFQFGRYHTDPRFPRELANDRYVHWIRNALSGSNPNNFVFVLGPPGDVVGFMDAVICDGIADLRLAAIDLQKSTGFAGILLYADSIRAVQERGAKSAIAKIAAANTPVMNIFSMLGFQFSSPQATFHWHAPTS